VILFLFLAHLGIGIIFSLGIVSKEAGVKFFRFNAGMAAVLIAVGYAFRPAGDGSRADMTALLALGIAEAATILYWGTIGRMLASIRPAILWTMWIAGAATLVAQGAALTPVGGVPMAMTVASFLTSAGLLGGTCTAMVLGHWYLVLPGMTVAHLQAVVKLHMISMVARVAVVGGAIALAIGTWEPGLGPSFKHYIFSVAGIFFWQRVAFGLVGPAILSYMTWETAKIQATQSATGILYVDFFTVVVGEVLAKYVLLTTLVPV
jgi:hypothetical protein